jgi:hypothetical protein
MVLGGFGFPNVRRGGAPARWRLLRRIAGYWIWTNFMLSFGTRAARPLR